MGGGVVSDKMQVWDGCRMVHRDGRKAIVKAMPAHVNEHGFLCMASAPNAKPTTVYFAMVNGEVADGSGFKVDLSDPDTCAEAVRRGFDLESLVK